MNQWDVIALRALNDADARTKRRHSRQVLSAFTAYPSETMVARLREREQLNRFVDPVVAASLVQGVGDITPRRTSVTVVIWDISGFTAFTEELRHAPQAPADFLAGYFGRAVSVIFGAGGVLDKFMGDAVMSLFGVDFENERAPDEELRQLGAAAAIGATRQMSDEFQKWVTEWMTHRRSRFAPYKIANPGMTAGLATAEAIVGNVGPPSRIEVSVIGGVANLASRLQKAAKRGQMMICETTAELAGLEPRRRPEVIQAKGFDHKVNCYRLPLTTRP